MTYQDFFKLKDTPFRLTPDCDYFFNSENHGAALETLLYSIRSGEGFVQITGQPGVGKTILVRHLLNQLGGDVTSALILHPRLGAEDLLKVILEDLGVSTDAIQNNTKEGLLRFFRQHLLETGRKGYTTVVIIDEAHEVPSDTLEELRLLSNLETEKKKLLSIILVGQTELEDKLNHRSLKQLHQRITIRYRIEPFTRTETRAYIHHRLSVAGAGDAIQFPNGVLNRIHRKSRGIARRINILCERALMAACVEGVQTIKPRHLKMAMESYLGTKAQSTGSRYAIRISAIIVAVLALGGAWWALFPEHRKTISVADREPTLFSKTPVDRISPGGTSIEKSSETPVAENPEPEELITTGPNTPDMDPRPIIKSPPVNRLPENWRCIVVNRHHNYGQVWKGNGVSITQGASFETINVMLDDGIYLLGIDGKHRPFILNHQSFEPWSRYQSLADHLWTQFGAETGLPVIPVIVSSETVETDLRLPEKLNPIRILVKNWAEAWRSLDLDRHMQYYATTHLYYPLDRGRPRVILRAQYRQIKERLFKKTRFIVLQISDPVCIINPANPDTAVAIFYQRYASSRYMDEGVKILFLRQIQTSNDAIRDWKIEGRFWTPLPSITNKSKAPGIHESQSLNPGTEISNFEPATSNFELETSASEP